jgi:hypothetical protein
MKYIPKKSFREAVADGVNVTGKWGSGYLIQIPVGVADPLKDEFKSVFFTKGIGIGFSYYGGYSTLLLKSK